MTIYCKDPATYAPVISVEPILADSEASNSTATLSDILFYTFTTAAGYNSFLVSQTVPQFGTAWDVENLNPEICEESDGVFTGIADGTATIRFSKNGFSKRKRLSFFDSTRTDYVWSGFTGASKSKALSDPILDRLIPGKSKAYFTGFVNGSSMTPDRNADCWAASFDLSASAISTDILGTWSTANSGALLTPRHWAGVPHWLNGSVENMGPGKKIRFAGADEVVHERTVVGRYIVPGKDMMICLLNSDLPESITPFPIAGNWFFDLTKGRAFGMGWQIRQNKNINPVGFDFFTAIQSGVNTANTVVWDATFINRTHPEHRLYGLGDFLESGVIGDSGGAIGGISQGLPFLVSLFTGPNSGHPYYEGIAPELNAIIAALDTAAGIDTGYNVTVAPDPTA